MPTLRCCLISMLLIASASTLAQKTTHNKQTGSKQQPPKPQTQAPKQPTPSRRVETFWQKVLRIAGISVTPSRLKGDDDALTGDVWLVDLQTKTALRLTREGGYRSPLVLPNEKAVFALKGETIYEIPLDGGAARESFMIKGIVKLAAVEVETRKHVLLLREDEARQTVVELLSLSDGTRTDLPYDSASDKDKQTLAYLRSWERSYGGKFTLYTRSESKDGPGKKRIEWSDVYLKEAGREAINLSGSNGVNCGHPALSLNGRYVVYIKAL